VGPDPNFVANSRLHGRDFDPGSWRPIRRWF
jgi:hypothetical protein